MHPRDRSYCGAPPDAHRLPTDRATRSTHLPTRLRLPGSGARSCSDGPQNPQGLGEPGDRARKLPTRSSGSPRARGAPRTARPAGRQSLLLRSLRACAPWGDPSCGPRPVPTPATGEGAARRRP